jgi:REP element-mobilizing transposase RayT
VTYQQACLFGKIVNGELTLKDLGVIADECWRAIPDHFDHVELGAYVIMPNHVHGIIIINDDRIPTVRARHASPQRYRSKPHGPVPGSVSAILGSFKSAVSKRIGREHYATGIWQRNYYEHIIQDDAELQRITAYIAANPVNWDVDNENPHTRR